MSPGLEPPGSIARLALPVARFTATSDTPGSSRRAPSTCDTHEAQVMPSTGTLRTRDDSVMFPPMGLRSVLRGERYDAGQTLRCLRTLLHRWSAQDGLGADAHLGQEQASAGGREGGLDRPQLSEDLLGRRASRHHVHDRLQMPLRGAQARQEFVRTLWLSLAARPRDF